MLASVVADVDVFLSAIAGKAALRVFTEFGLMVHVAEFTADEVVEYLPVMARKHTIPSEVIDMQWRLLAVHRHPTSVYRRALPRAVPIWRGGILRTRTSISNLGRMIALSTASTWCGMRRRVCRTYLNNNARHGNTGGALLPVRGRPHKVHAGDEKLCPRYNRVSVRDGSRCCCHVPMMWR